MKAPFFRIVKSAAYGLDKEAALRGLCEKVKRGASDPMLYDVDPAEFKEIEESPFAYWVSGAVRARLKALPRLEPDLAVVRQGMATASDFRFLRLWFEVPPERVARTRDETLRGKKWVGFAKGGKFAPYYDDVRLVVNWERDGEEAKLYASGLYGGQHWTRILKNVDFMFRAGLTYPRRADSLNVRALPAGCGFGDKGPGLFAECEEDLMSLLGLLNSKAARWFSLMRVPIADAAAAGVSPAFEVGALQILRLPHAPALGPATSEIFELHRRKARFLEPNHLFVAPLLASGRDGLASAWNAEQQFLRDEHEPRLRQLQAEQDAKVLDAFAIPAEDRTQILADMSEGPLTSTSAADDEDDADDEPAQSGSNTLRGACESLISYAVGCAFGRFDVRIGRDPTSAPPWPGPFEPLPTRSPATLVGQPTDYPLTPAWDGVLLDDADHPRDLVLHLHSVFEALFGAQADTRIAELESLIGSDLRTYLRDAFFEDKHRPDYTMGGSPPRRAPIYWPLYPRIGKRRAPFGIWLCYLNLTRDSFFTALKLVRTRRESLEQRVMKLDAEREGKSARELRQLTDRADEQRVFAQALIDFEKKLQAVTDLDCLPDFDDGVVLNCAVLHELIDWKDDPKQRWQELQAGEHDWSNIAAKLSPKRAAAFRETEQKAAAQAKTKKKKP